MLFLLMVNENGLDGKIGIDRCTTGQYDVVGVFPVEYLFQFLVV